MFIRKLACLLFGHADSGYPATLTFLGFVGYYKCPRCGKTVEER